MQLHDRIRQLRTERGLTMKELADRSDLSLPYIADIEHGRTNPSLKSLAAIAAGLETSVIGLLTGVDLMGEAADAELPPGLAEMMQNPAFSDDISEEWLSLLRQIQLRGRRPSTVREWMEVYLFLRRLLGDDGPS
jgi:transcriptional regulator with XRE-family HTH domain